MSKFVLASQELARLYAVSLGMSAEMNKKYTTLEMFAYNFVRFLDKKYIGSGNRRKCLQELNETFKYIPYTGIIRINNISSDFAEAANIISNALMNNPSTKRVETPHLIAAMLRVKNGLAGYILNKYADLENYFKDTCSEIVLKDVEFIVNSIGFKLLGDDDRSGIKVLFLDSLVTKELEEMLDESSDLSFNDIVDRLDDKDEFVNISREIGNALSKNIITPDNIDDFLNGEQVELDLIGLTQINYINMLMNVVNKKNYSCSIMSNHLFGSEKATGELTGDYITKSDIQEGIKVIENTDLRMGLSSMTSNETNNEEHTDSKNMSNEELNKEYKRYSKIMTDLCPCISDREDYDNEPFVGRQEEIDKTLKILCRKNKNNPLHVGEPGVGKTAIITGLVKLVRNNNFPKKLINPKIHKLDVMGLVAGTRYRGDFEERLKRILKGLELEADLGNTPIVYIDEIHTILNAGDSSGVMSAGQMLKQSLESGKVRYIGSTTNDEYDKIFSKDKALDRRFKRIMITEPSKDECFKILKGSKEYYEEYHGINISDKALLTIIDLTDKYIKDRMLPDKAIDIIDEAGALKNVHPDKVKGGKITCKIVEEIIAKNCNIPVETINETEAARIMKLENEFKANIFGQDAACKTVDNCIKLSRAGLGDDNKPVANLLFVGPTGVGKTELAKTVANTLNIPLIRFDMSEFKEEYSISKLIGSAPGYVGYDEGGLLVKKIRENPYSVLLLDEIEKAHPSVYDLLLQVMDNAELTDNRGRKADFRNVILIMTSNAGARDMNIRRLGFNSDGSSDILGNEAMKKAVKDTFKPEFLNRLTEVVEFNYLGDSVARRIADKKIGELETKLKSKGISIKFSENAIDYIIKNGVSTDFGAREIGRIIDKEVKVDVANIMFSGEVKNKAIILVDCINNKLVVKKEA